MSTAPLGRPARILVIDNYDSFVYNLVQYLAQLGAEVVVIRNDEIGAGDIDLYADANRIDGVLISPGPGTPDAPAAVAETIGSSVRTVERELANAKLRLENLLS